MTAECRKNMNIESPPESQFEDKRRKRKGCRLEARLRSIIHLLFSKIKNGAPKDSVMHWRKGRRLDTVAPGRCYNYLNWSFRIHQPV